MNLKRSLIRLHQLSSQFGIDPRRFARAFVAISAFIHDYTRFRRTCRGPMTFNPQLHDRHTEAGVTKSEYFWQDLIVARWIHEANPERHVDVGSRTDGFVAHVASFREIEVFDVRPITTEIPGVTFRQADLMDAVGMAAWQGGNAGGGGTATLCPASMCSSTLDWVATAIPSTQTATKSVLPISPVCFAPAGVFTSRHPSARSASNSTPTGCSIQPPFWGWPNARGFGWSGFRRSIRGRGCGSSPRKRGAKPWPHSQPSTTTLASLSLRDHWRAQGNRDRHDFKSARQGSWQATLAEPVSKQPERQNQVGVLS